MPSAYETAVDSFRARLLKVDEIALNAVTDAYRPIQKELAKSIAELEADLSEVTSAADLHKLARYRTLLEQVEAESARLAQQAGSVIVEGQQTVVGMAQDEVRAVALAGAADTSATLADVVASGFNRLNTSAFTDLVGRLSDGSPLSDYLAKLPDSFGAIIKDELTRGIALGKSPREIADILNQKLYGGVGRLLTTTRTVMLDSYRSASLRSMAENADILDGFVWTAAHDSRTCLACLALDGKMFPLTTTFAPCHSGCRCAMRPVVSGASPSKRETGQQWFDRQPEAVQNSMLPIYAQQPYKDGKVKLNDFVTLDKDPVWGDRYRQGSVADKVGYTRGGSSTSGGSTKAKRATPTSAPRKLTPITETLPVVQKPTQGSGGQAIPKRANP